jgi:hypothetical protein
MDRSLPPGPVWKVAYLRNGGSAQGGFAILTARFPGEPERDRRIIGLFKISKIEDRNNVETSLGGRVRLPI